MVLCAALAVTAAVGMAQAQGTPPMADMTKVMDAIRLRQADLDQTWAKFDFVETYRLEDLPPAPKPIIKNTYVYHVHQLGNSELFRLVTYNGKPLDEKLQNQWDAYEQKAAHYLEEHPRTTEQHSRNQMLCTDIASQMLRTLEPLSMTYESSSQDHTDLVIQVRTDEDLWSRFDGSTLHRNMVGTIRADAKTFTVKEIKLRANKGDSFHGGVIRIDPGVTMIYRQSEIDHKEIPHLEIYGVMGRILKDRFQTSEVWDFSDFEPTKP
jgi:hypothetical protein